MGSAKLDLRTIELSRPQELVIKLEDQSRPFRSLGELKINITLWPKTQEDKEQVNYCTIQPVVSIVSERINVYKYC